MHPGNANDSYKTMSKPFLTSKDLRVFLKSLERLQRRYHLAAEVI